MGSLRLMSEKRNSVSVGSDPGAAARLRKALLHLPGSHDAERVAAAAILARWPWAPDLLRAAYGFHRRAAGWAVSSSPPAAGIIFTSSGLPARTGSLHALAAAASPDVLVGYVDA